MNWAQLQRQSFIMDFARNNGRINRIDICEEFHVSVPTASSDLTNFNLRNPGVLEYDRNEKTYFYAASD